MEEFEVVIIGGGPAGLRAAEVLAKKRIKVLVLEKNKNIGAKVCAGGLTFKNFEIGIPLSLTDRIFNSLQIHIGEKRIEIKKRDRLLVATIDRERLGQWMLVRARNSGAKVRMGAKVERIEERKVRLSNGQIIKYDYLIGADGSLSLTRRWLGLSTKKAMITFQYLLPLYFEKLEIFFNKKLFGLGYAWIFPHGEFTSIGCGNILESDNNKNKELWRNFRFWLEEKKIKIKRQKPESFLINYDYQGFDFGRKFLVGDAAGLAFGITGEGLYSALVSGEEVAQKILNPSYSCPKIKRIIKMKKFEGKIGRFLQFLILRNKNLTNLVFKKLF